MTYASSPYASPAWGSAGPDIEPPVNWQLIPPAHRVEVRVRDRFGDPISGTPALQATGVRFSVALGGSGFLALSADARAEPLASTPTLIDDCTVTIAVPPGGAPGLTDVAAYAVRGRSGTRWDKGVSTRDITGAPTLFTQWAQDAILHPEANAITRGTGEMRYFGWMSTLYDPDADPDHTWVAPSDSTGRQDSTTGNRSGQPEAWPAALGHAKWITRNTSAADEKWRHLFIKDITLANDAFLKIWASSDESIMVYFGGELVIQTSSSETGFLYLDEWQGWVTAGTYRIAVDKTSVVTRPGGNGRDPILIAVTEQTPEDDIDSVVVVSDDTWQVYALSPDDPDVPSLTPGQIIEQLAAEAVDRGVTTWQGLTLDFDGDTDSDGQPWPLREERAWRVAYDTYLDMIEGLGDLGFCPDITPDLTFKAWSDRGSDLSATVVVEAAHHADSIIETGAGVAATYLPVETQDGWVVVDNAPAASVYGRREAALSLGNAPSINQGRKLGQRVLDERLSRPTAEWSVEMYARPGCVPLVDFAPGDTIGVKIGSTTTPRVVLEVGGEAASVNDVIRWTIKTGDAL